MYKKKRWSKFIAYCLKSQVLSRDRRSHSHYAFSIHPFPPKKKKSPNWRFLFLKCNDFPPRVCFLFHWEGGLETRLEIIELSPCLFRQTLWSECGGQRAITATCRYLPHIDPALLFFWSPSDSRPHAKWIICVNTVTRQNNENQSFPKDKEISHTICILPMVWVHP